MLNGSVACFIEFVLNTPQAKRNRDLLKLYAMREKLISSVFRLAACHVLLCLLYALVGRVQSPSTENQEFR